MKSVTVILPTTCSPSFVKSAQSVLNQTYPETYLYLVIDGNFQHKELPKFKTNPKTHILNLPYNVGANGFYGHRIYAAIPHLVNTDYVMFLDQDCWFDDNHVETMVSAVNQKDWAYSLRKIADKNGNYICNDDCESLGPHKPVMDYEHVDTNCYILQTAIAIRVCHIFFGKWGMDRIFYNTLKNYYKNFDGSGKYTVNYCVDGNEGSVKPEFFLHWNSVVYNKTRQLPWRK